MSAGLTLDKDSVKVALLNAKGGKIADLTTSDYTLNVTSEVDGKATTFNVAITNAYLQKNDFYASNAAYTSVTYSAKLNKYAVVGKAGNPNTETKLVYANKNGVESEVTGNTVYVYTFAVTTNKTDTAGKALEGAEFSLLKQKRMQLLLLTQLQPVHQTRQARLLTTTRARKKSRLQAVNTISLKQKLLQATTSMVKLFLLQLKQLMELHLLMVHILLIVRRTAQLVLMLRIQYYFPTDRRCRYCNVLCYWFCTCN